MMQSHWLKDVRTGRREVVSVKHSLTRNKMLVTFNDDVEIEVTGAEAEELQRAVEPTGFDLDRLLDALG